MSSLLKKSIYLAALCCTILYCRMARVDSTTEIKKAEMNEQEMQSEDVKLSQNVYYSSGMKEENVLLSFFGNETTMQDDEKDASASVLRRGSEKKLRIRNCVLPCPDSAYANEKMLHKFNHINSAKILK